MKPIRAKRHFSPGQGELFGLEQIASVYQATPDTAISNAALYSLVSQKAGVPISVIDERVPVGKSGQKHSLARRAIRWGQQDLKRQGILERVKGERGVWRLTEAAKRDLHAAKSGVKLLGFRTDLGIAVWGPSGDIFKNLHVPVSLVYSSPPYALRRPRAYGNPDEREIVDFICDTLEPVIEAMAEDASLVLNVSNDVFHANSPARSTYVERLTLEICDRFNPMWLMDRLIWENKSKMPGPMQWCSRTRQQLQVSWEPLLWFARNPLKVKSDNRRVLEPHSERHLKLMQAGGENRETNYGDGAYRLKVGSFGTPTPGRIPNNIITRGHRCAHGSRYRKAAIELGLPTHGAGQPFSVPEFLIRFLTEEGDLVVDPFSGRGMTSLAAELNNRAWMSGEINLEYIRSGAELFRGRPGFWLNPQIERAFSAGKRER
ncbi:N-4 cytosine specific DNA methylase [Pseudomonas veronii 1YdBTEX2]|uniref:Methyltransferase n=3 Tax=Pseudomonas veronii TaxID=76761 RepID=A0ABS0VPQ4_PSEVE|nr:MULTISPECIES: site-specific DNA-methyltransferase [Pseudomonas]SBW84043.1 N-4 cytosine specific DNA methylase [Pseudomonas veronii 1YdBTEX2]MBI6556966.1 site-specific DNA-methyltransferase [Pseudomonas veronii]MBI6653523.1 site-specific DNA-methyltransferase [Pseudomonas veronii]MBJ2180040.1 site-specific DNA-methyltransferase [Pseudomonas veronii]MDB1108900.1 DNA methyltransferase [Pseudomonas extremaustralis]